MKKNINPQPFLLLVFSLLQCAAVYGSEKYADQKIVIYADTIHYSDKEKIVTARGSVVIERESTRIQADYATFDNKSEIGIIEGNVIIEDPETHLEAKKAVINMKTSLGTVFEARGFIASTYYLSGKEVERLSENRYKIVDGSITTCCDTPAPWKIEAKKAYLHMEHYAYVSHPLFKIRDFPVFYFPYFVFPIKTKRQTGLLPPVFGGSGKEGITVTNRFFWAISDSQDTTLSWQHKELRGEKFALEYRYMLSRESFGNFDGSYTFDYEPENQTRPVLWKVNYDHRQALPYKTTGVVHIEKVSKTNPDRKFDIENINTRSKLYTDSYLNISRNWNTRSLQMTLRRRDSIESASSERFSERFDEIPSVVFTNSSEAIVETPLYFSLESSFKGFRKVNEGTTKTDTRVNRVDAFPALSLPMSLAPWLSVTPSASYRQTWYSNGLEQKGFSRGFYEAGISASGPKLYRIFSFRSASFKHLVEPELSYSHISNIGRSVKEQIIEFDELDKVGRVGKPDNTIRYALSNIVLKKTPLAGVHEVARLRLTHSFDIQEFRRRDNEESPKRPFGDLAVMLQTKLHPNVSFDYYNTFDVYTKRGVSETIDLDINFPDRWYLTLERRKKVDRSTGTPSSITDIGTFGINLRNRLKFEFGTHYDELRHTQKEMDYSITYSAGCWELSFDLINRRLSDEREVRHETKLFFTVTLKDIITYGDKGPLGFIKRRF